MTASNNAMGGIDPATVVQRQHAYGQERLTCVDRLGVWLSKRPIESVVRAYANPAVLDLGCGYEARLLRGLAGNISAGVGVDVCLSQGAKSTPRLSFLEQTIEQALGIAAPASSAGVASTLAATGRGERFDVVLLISVLEHLWEPLPVLGACRGLLKPGGSLVINVPNWLGKRFLEFSAFRLGMSPASEMDDHKMYYAKRDLWPLLVRAGFRPSGIRMRYHKLGLNLFAVAVKGS